MSTDGFLKLLDTVKQTSLFAKLVNEAVRNFDQYL